MDQSSPLWRSQGRRQLILDLTETGSLPRPYLYIGNAWSDAEVRNTVDHLIAFYQYDDLSYDVVKKHADSSSASSADLLVSLPKLLSLLQERPLSENFIEHDVL